jgi:hypothetical protein
VQNEKRNGLLHPEHYELRARQPGVSCGDRSRVRFPIVRKR